ncbi:BolA domain UV induced protein Uvi31 [Coemansia erecta]|nr:BolA domain UV induced protein Uvi31 [Coemansia erecta]
MSTQSSRVAGPLEKLIEERITEEFSPSLLQIKNESHMHRHHAPMQGVTSTETHFRVKVVSEKFAGLPMIRRHRHVYRVLADKLKAENGIHALALETKTQEEMQQKCQKQ